MTADSTLTSTRQRLSVRSAVLSVLLGCYPEAIPSGQLVSTARRFDMSESAVRVALTRGLAKGELERTASGYRIGERLLQRYGRQSEAVAAISEPWDGSWETAFVVAGARSASDRSALRNLLAEHRLTELREGVWLRPANLARPRGYEAHDDLVVCESRQHDAVRLAARLWDLEGWSQTGRQLIDELDASAAAADRLAVAAALVRHLSTDPILPAELLPADWAGEPLRAAYGAYQEELRQVATEA